MITKVFFIFCTLILKTLWHLGSITMNKNLRLREVRLYLREEGKLYCSAREQSTNFLLLLL